MRRNRRIFRSMTTDEVIQQIRAFSKPDELDKLRQAVDERRAEVQADSDAANRIEELQSGRTKPLTHEQVFQSVRKNVREG
jgi:hypothetical protein